MFPIVSSCLLSTPLIFFDPAVEPAWALGLAGGELCACDNSDTWLKDLKAKKHK